MSIKINANFELGAAQFLDQREAVETLDELLALNTNIIPDGFEVYVKEKDCKYKYNSTYTESDTGCWKKVNGVETDNSGSGNTVNIHVEDQTLICKNVTIENKTLIL